MSGISEVGKASGLPPPTLIVFMAINVRHDAGAGIIWLAGGRKKAGMD